MKSKIAGFIFVLIGALFFGNTLGTSQSKKELKKYLGLFYEEAESELLMKGMKVNHVVNSSSNYQVRIRGGYYIDNGAELIIVIKAKDKQPINEEKIHCSINQQKNIDESGATFLMSQKFATDPKNRTILKLRFISSDKVLLQSINIEIDSELVTMRIPNERSNKIIHYAPLEDNIEFLVKDLYLSPFSFMYCLNGEPAKSFDQITIHYKNGKKKTIELNNGFISTHKDHEYIYLHFFDKVNEIEQIESLEIGDVIYVL